MKRTLLAIGLLLSASAALAEWEQIAAFEDRYIFIESSRIRKNGNTVKFWTMYSYNTYQDMLGANFLSTITLNELDCKNESIRVLARSDYSEKMAGGKSISSFDNPGRWINIAPGTIADHYLDRYCHNKK